MVAAVGCPADAFLYASSSSSERRDRGRKRLGLQTIMAVMQILDQTLSRLRYSTQARILAELALCESATWRILKNYPALIVQLKTATAGNW